MKPTFKQMTDYIQALKAANKQLVISLKHNLSKQIQLAEHYSNVPNS